MNRIDKKFKELRAKRKKAFIAFITAGYPDLKITYNLALEFAKAGVDILELGVPFSDPIADGKVIQASSFEALKIGVNLDKILKLVKDIRIKTQMPLCLMTYYNPIFCFGEERFCRFASAAGVDGIIIPDLPPDEGKSFLKLAKKFNLDCICFIAPTTTHKRMEYIAGVARGFIYYVSLTGVTGERSQLPKDLLQNLSKVKKLASVPVCAGFGVSTREQVKEISKVADGVIVGSAIIKKIKENLKKKDLAVKVARFVKGLIDV